MNLSLDQLPAQCDALVVGAGPAGSAAATILARAGLSTVLIDQHAFPRDKVCGDGLIPDAHRALAQLGVLDTVMAQAQAASHVGCIAPRGGRVDVPGTLAVLPRRQLDMIVCEAAVRAGARMAAPVRFVGPVEDNGKVVGARLRQGEQEREVRCRWVILATGAVPQALLAAGVCDRHTPSGVALRGYVRNEAMVDQLKALEIVWHRALSPGYGWIFPLPGGEFNIGVGWTDSQALRHSSGRETNLRDVFEAFTRVYAPARELVATGTWVSPLKGAPLRCTLEGAKWSRPGMLVTGEAAGSTYSFSGEGIGKALETGILAAQAVIDGQSDDDAVVRARFEASLAALRPRFALYDRANWVNSHPWLTDLLIWRARRSPGIVRRMTGVLEETSNPGHLLTAKGLVRLFTE